MTASAAAMRAETSVWPLLPSQTHQEEAWQAGQRPAPQAAAVLTQLAVCSAVFVVSVLAFCFLRTRWQSIYAPRTRNLFCDSDEAPRAGFCAWLKPVLSVKEEEMIVKIGLDSATFIRTLSLFVRLSFFMLFFGATVLAPVNYYAGLGHGDRKEGDGDPGEIGRPEVDVFQSFLFSIDHVPRGSPFLSVHAACVWLFSVATLTSLYRGYRVFISARQHFLTHLKKGPQTRTVMVLGIPHAYRDEEKLRQWFERLGIGPVCSVVVVRDARLIERRLKQRYRELRRLEDAACSIAARSRGCLTVSDLIRRVGASGYSAVLNTDDLTEEEAREAIYQMTPAHRPKVRTGFAHICGPAVDAFDYYKEKFVNADAEVRWLRKRIETRPYGTAFVKFAAQGSANIAAQLMLHTDPHTFVTLMAPEPRDVYWPNAPLPPALKTVRATAIHASYFFLTVFWAVPTAAITSLLTLAAIRRVAPQFADWMSDTQLVRSFVEGTLPTVVIASLNAGVPYILEILAILEGTRSYSGIDTRSMSTLYAFYVANVLLVVTIAGTLWKTLAYLAQQPASIVNVLGTSLPKVSFGCIRKFTVFSLFHSAGLSQITKALQMSAFFVNYILLQGLVIYPLFQLLQIGRLLPTFAGKLFSNTPRQLSSAMAPPTTRYGYLLPLPLLLFTITSVYSTINPLVLLAGSGFFVIAKLVHTYHALHVFHPRYESGGKLWSIVHRSVLVALMLYQLTMIGLLLSRKAPRQAGSLAPLPIITCSFAWYCQKAFGAQQRFLSLDVVACTPPAAAFLEGEQLRSGGGAVTATKKKNAAKQDDDEARPLLLRTAEGPAGGARLRPEDARVQRPANSAPPSQERNTAGGGMGRMGRGRTGGRFEPPSTIVRGILDDEPTDYSMPQFCGRLPQPWFPKGFKHLEHQVRREAEEAYRKMERGRSDGRRAGGRANQQHTDFGDDEEQEGDRGEAGRP